MKNSATRKTKNNRSYGNTYHNFKTKTEVKLLRAISQDKISNNAVENFKTDTDGGKIWSF